jgi:hypothetical protein
VQLEGVVGVGARQLGPPHRPDGEEEPADRASGPPGRDQPARGRIGDRRDAERERTPDPAPDQLPDSLAPAASTPNVPENANRATQSRRAPVARGAARVIIEGPASRISGTSFRSTVPKTLRGPGRRVLSCELKIPDATISPGEAAGVARSARGHSSSPRAWRRTRAPRRRCAGTPRTRSRRPGGVGPQWRDDRDPVRIVAAVVQGVPDDPDPGALVQLKAGVKVECAIVVLDDQPRMCGRAEPLVGRREALQPGLHASRGAAHVDDDDRLGVEADRVEDAGLQIDVGDGRRAVRRRAPSSARCTGPDGTRGVCRSPGPARRSARAPTSRMRTGMRMSLRSRYPKIASTSSSERDRWGWDCHRRVSWDGRPPSPSTLTAKPSRLTRPPGPKSLTLRHDS